nr:GtrA family protein [Halopseudomonas salegens]
MIPANTFLRYSSVGVLNTVLHWSIFLLLVSLFGISQAISNTIAFMAAVSFSYLATAHLDLHWFRRCQPCVPLCQFNDSSEIDLG